MSEKNDKERKLFEDLDKLSGEELIKALDTVINTFNSSYKIQKEFYQDRFSNGIQTAVKTGLLNTEDKIKLIDFIKDCCDINTDSASGNRLVGKVQGIALDKEEIMKVRWYACDALKELSPEQYEIYMSMSVLRNRASDPDKPALDISEARKLINEQEKKNFIWWVLSPFLIFGSMVLLYVSWNKPYFFPIVFGLIGVVVLFLLILFLSIYRCPSCKRHFAREKLVLRSTSQGASIVTSGSHMVTNFTVKFYSAHCKYCKHEWLIKR